MSGGGEWRSGSREVEAGVAPLGVRGRRGPLPVSVASEEWLLAEQRSPLGRRDPAHLVSDVEVPLQRGEGTPLSSPRAPIRGGHSGAFFKKGSLQSFVRPAAAAV